jgi:predicted GNAT family acetyltransferase
MNMRSKTTFRLCDLNTQGAEVVLGIAGIQECFEIRAGRCRATGYLANQDFPNQTSIATRGEIFFIEVPKENRGRGLGASLFQDAIRLIVKNGSSTVNLSPTSQEGKALVASMIRNGVVGETIQQSKFGKRYS